MNASDSLETAIGTHLLRSGSWTKPTNLYVALFTALPTDSGGGTEVSGGSYARVACGPGDSYWTEQPPGTFQNANAVTFPNPTNDWNTIVGFGLFTASSGGTLLVWGELSVSRLVLSGDLAPSFPAGNLVISVG